MCSDMRVRDNCIPLHLKYFLKKTYIFKTQGKLDDEIHALKNYHLYVHVHDRIWRFTLPSVSGSQYLQLMSL